MESKVVKQVKTLIQSNVNSDQADTTGLSQELSLPPEVA